MLSHDQLVLLVSSANIPSLTVRPINNSVEYNVKSSNFTASAGTEQLSLSVAVLERFYCSYVTLRCDLEL